jgi:hypothetical protein
MKMNHREQLDIIAYHHASFGVEVAIEPRTAKTGEIPDTVGMFEMGLSDLWPGCNISAGAMIVGDCKLSVSDLQHDELKPCRHENGIGDLRLYWIRKDGPVEPKHVLEDSWWGTAVYDDHGFEIVKPPRWFFKTNKLKERLLIRRLALDAGGIRSTGQGSPARTPSRAVRRGPDKLAVRVAEWIGDTPATTGDVKRYLRTLGIKKTPREIDQMLRTNSDVLPPECDGGVWQVKTNAAESA